MASRPAIWENPAMRKMKAVRLVAMGKPLEMQEVPVPEPGPGEVLVEIKAAGICHSDAHYRAGVSSVSPLPMTLGHEVSGIVDRVGERVDSVAVGERVCLHYLATCAKCRYCQEGQEQFCVRAQMMGKHRHGGYAEYIVMPERSVFQLPPEIPFAHGAILMCSSATSLHALKKARLQAGETVAVFGAGGLGISAIQLAFAFGADKVFAVDIDPNRLKLAESFGAIGINARETNPVAKLKDATGGQGVDVSLELIGLPITMGQAVQVLAIRGRAALAGITRETFPVSPYHELINKEAEIIGVSDHLAQELPLLLRLAQSKKLDLSHVVTNTLLLDAGKINSALDNLEQFGPGVRSLIQP